MDKELDSIWVRVATYLELLEYSEEMQIELLVQVERQQTLLDKMDALLKKSAHESRNVKVLWNHIRKEAKMNEIGREYTVAVLKSLRDVLSAKDYALALSIVKTELSLYENPND